MAENLDYYVSGSKCYNNSEDNCAIYGRLYNWVTAMALPSSCSYSICASQISTIHRGICPSGWHIPSRDEWKTLTNFVGGSSTAGTKLKATSGWNNSGNGTDSYGFSALPGGGSYTGDDFGNVGYIGSWWVANQYEYTENVAHHVYIEMKYDSYYADFYSPVESGLKYSVRCLKD